MTFLFDLPNEQLLPHTFDLAEEIEDFVTKTDIMSLRKAPEGGETVEEAGKKALKNMLRRACKDNPTETAALLNGFWLLEDGEQVPGVFKTVNKVLTSNNATDFFTLLLRFTQ